MNKKKEKSSSRRRNQGCCSILCCFGILAALSLSVFTVFEIRSFDGVTPEETLEDFEKVVGKAEDLLRKTLFSPKPPTAAPAASEASVALTDAHEGARLVVWGDDDPDALTTVAPTRKRSDIKHLTMAPTTPEPEQPSEEPIVSSAPTTVDTIYCHKARVYLQAMMELAHRTLVIPAIDDGVFAPVSLSRGSHPEGANYKRTVPELEAMQRSPFVFQLEGATVVPMAVSLERGFSNLPPGWYCLSVLDPGDECIIGSVPFVILDKARKDSEYGVRPTRLDMVASSKASEPIATASPVKAKQSFRRTVAPITPAPLDYSAQYERPSKEEPKVVVAWVAKYLPSGLPFPVVVTAPRLLDTLFGETHAGVLSEATSQQGSTAQYNKWKASEVVRMTGGVVELYYGKGSAWILPGAAFHTSCASVYSRMVRKDQIGAASNSESFASTSDAAPTFDKDFEAFFSHYSNNRRSVAPFPNSDPRHSSVQHKKNFLDLYSRSSMTTRWGSNPKFGKKELMRLIGKDVEHFSVLNLGAGLNVTVGVVPLGMVQNLSSADAFVNALREHVELEEKGAGGAPCVLHLLRSITIDANLELSGITCSVIVEEGAVITIDVGTEVSLSGTADAPLLFTSSCVACKWGGFLVMTGSLTLKYTMIAMTGSEGVIRAKNTGSHIKNRAPAITASGGSRLVVQDSAILNGDGPGFALGPKAVVRISSTLIQDVAQGGECVSCDIIVNSSHVIDVPYTNNNFDEFVDGDNDGFYFRGGSAIFDNSVIMNTLDDGIDSATTAKDPTRSILTIRKSFISNIQHEGVALSSSKGTSRQVTISDSIVSRCQQGIENGHSSSQHHTTISKTIFAENHIGFRHGDNYPLDVFGAVQLVDPAFLYNEMHVLNHVRKEQMLRGNAPRVFSIYNPALGLTINGTFTVTPKIFMTRPVFADVPPVEGRSVKAPVRFPMQRRASAPNVSSFILGSGSICGSQHFEVNVEEPMGALDAKA